MDALTDKQEIVASHPAETFSPTQRLSFSLEMAFACNLCSANLYTLAGRPHYFMRLRFEKAGIKRTPPARSFLCKFVYQNRFASATDFQSGQAEEKYWRCGTVSRFISTGYQRTPGLSTSSSSMFLLGTFRSQENAGQIALLSALISPALAYALRRSAEITSGCGHLSCIRSSPSFQRPRWWGLEFQLLTSLA